jgi:ribosomal protein L24E
MTYTEFLRRFPDNDACLEYLKEKFYADGTPCPKCGKPSKFHRIKGRSAYSCQFCGHHVYPTAGTIFHKSTTSLQLWFWAIFLIASSKCGISAKQLGREIGVTYKTAWRMMREIRTLLGDDLPPLSGEIQVDETNMRGGLRAGQTRGKTRQEIKQLSDAKNKGRIVLAAVEPKGRVKAAVVSDRSKPTLQGKVKEFVLPESMIFTDELKLYRGIGKDYRGHRRINHSQRIYVESDGATTNAVESFFALFKNSVRGAHHSISAKYLPHYLNEYTFRWNRRRDEQPIFWAILDRARKNGLAVQ